MKSISDMIAAMQNEGVRRLVVAAPDGHLAGIVSVDDLPGARAMELAGLARAIRGGIARESVERGTAPTRRNQEIPAPTA